MTDYYGIGDIPFKRSITEALIKKYQSAKTSEIKDNYDKHVAQASLDQNEYDGLDSDVHESVTGNYGDPSKNTIQNLWSFVNSYIRYKTTQLIYGIYGAEELDDFAERETMENLLIQKRTATSYRVWIETCEKLDKLQKFDDWKNQKESTLFDYKYIDKSLHDLREARLAGDVRKLLYLIRTTWSRNMGNIGNVNLYRHSHTGTKTLIEEYLNECELSLDEVTKENVDHIIDDRYILSMLVQTRKNIGRTALVLSGGGCFGLFHIGVLAALLEENVLPRIISGSSAGAIVAGILCVHNRDEITDLIGNIVDRKFDIFDSSEKQEGFLMRLARFLKYGTWYDITYLQKTMIEFLGDLTFREAYNRTGRILNITVSPASVYEHPRLLNYLTAPSVLIWSAVCASCSLPGIFLSSTIYEKNSKTGLTQEWHHTSVKFVDGSVDNDLPITRLSEMFNVDHIVACQVNPHVVPFLKLSVTCVGGEVETEYSAKLKTKLSQFYGIWSAEVSHYLHMCEEIGIARNICTKLRSVLSQQYSGDITILPDLKEVFKLNKLLANPTPQFLLSCTMKGARATWPKITMIRNHCRLEFALDNSIKLLRSRNFKNLNSNLALVNSPNFGNFDVKGTTDTSKNNVLNSLDQSLNQKHRNGNGVLKRTKSAHHNRHRSETLTVGGMKSLRTVQSNLSVNTVNDQIPHASKTFKPSKSEKYHRSYSASDEVSSFFTPQTYALPVSESSSPLKLQNNPDGYFKNQTSAKKSNKVNFRKPTFSTSSSSETITSPLRQRRSFVNVDGLDGLFDGDESTKNEEDLDVDPIKIDDHTSPSSSDS